MIIHDESPTIAHRSRTYQFEEFLQSWGDKLKVQAAAGTGGGASTVTVKLLQDVDRFAVCYE